MVVIKLRKWHSHRKQVQSQPGVKERDPQFSVKPVRSGGGHLLRTGIPRGQEEKCGDTELESVLKWRGGKVLQDARQTRRGSAATFFP